MLQKFYDKIDLYLKDYENYYKATGSEDLEYRKSNASEEFSKNSRLRLYYEREAGGREVFFIVPSIFNSPEILFTGIGDSFVKLLKKTGKKIFLIEWKESDDPHFSLGDYVKEVIDILRLISKDYEKINLIGHCLGGNFALAAATLSKAKISSLALFTTPWDSGGFKLYSRLYGAAGLGTSVAGRMVPPIYSRILFFLYNGDYLEKKIDKYFGLSDKKEALLSLKIEKWLSSGISLPSRAWFDLMEIFWENSFAENKWIVKNKIIDPSTLDIPVFLSYGSKDSIVPPASALSLAGKIKNLTKLETKGGHIEYLTGKGVRSFFGSYMDFLNFPGRRANPLIAY